MSHDIVDRMPQTCLIPSHESDLQVVHGLAAELRCIAHDHARDDGFVKFSGTRWLAYYHSLDRILMEHDRRQAEIYKASDEIERLREALRVEKEELAACCIDRKETQRERDEARRLYINEMCLREYGDLSARIVEARERGWDCFKEATDER